MTISSRHQGMTHKAIRPRSLSPDHGPMLGQLQPISDQGLSRMGYPCIDGCGRMTDTERKQRRTLVDLMVELRS
ncbi:hypothetical protein D0846_15050 [Bordetella avium]|nr:hypothetical protein D0848_12710 [Bordetella avium]RIQ40844.1 hypothetical protein D0846_15050 [Bordetella avium]RIQ69680.1 hypothetical protein D0836_15305 [Bordetella avium]